MRLAVTGTTGRLGAALLERLDGSHEVIALPRTVCDFADFASLDSALADLECDVLLNPAAISSVEACEEDPRAAMRVNSAAAGRLALWAADRGVRMIHFSTDYVFDGRLPGLRTEADPTSPVNAYGRSKLAGERAVLMHPGHLVLRVSWLFGPEKPSFIDRIIDLALAGEPLAAVADKWSLPTHTADLCSWVGDLLGKEVSGVLHACHSGEPVSWHEMAEVIVAEMADCGVLPSRPQVAKMALDDNPAFKARRPRHSAMSCERMASHLSRPPAGWRESLRDYVRRRCG